MKKIKWLLLPVVLFIYAGVFIATKRTTCDSECQQFTAFEDAVRLNRPFVNYVSSITPQNDPIMVHLDSSRAHGMNWALFADTVCNLASAAGFPGRQLYVLHYRTALGGWDTLARPHCP